MQEMAGTVGPPLPCTAFRLEAVPEMNYDPCALPCLLFQKAPVVDHVWEILRSCQASRKNA